jgi:two-component system, NtrC family, sensor kinase
MKGLALSILLSLIGSYSLAQNRRVIDSLKHELAIAKHDTAKVMLCSKIVLENSSLTIEERLDFGLKGYELSKIIDFEKGQIECGLNTGFIMVEKDYFKALTILHEIKPLCESNKDPAYLAKLLAYLAYGYDKFDSKRGFYYYRACLSLMLKTHVSEAIVPIYTIMGYSFKDAGVLDSALIYLQKGYQSSLKGISPIPTSYYPRQYGEIYYKKGEKNLAMAYYRQSITEFKYQDGETYLGIARIYKDRNQLDSAKFYAKAGLKILQSKSRTIYIIQAAQLLFDLYKDSDPKEALKYLVIATTTKDSLFNQNKAMQVEKLYFEEKEKIAENQRLIELKQNKIKFYTLLGVLGVFLLLSYILYRNNREKQKNNLLLQEQKEKVERTLSQLKATQAQLIQKEKLASLGELTAGIAHEIQNPLNFVNNFSELSVDLIKELQEERQKIKEERDEALEDELLSDLSQNQAKINQHGKRASSIVKGMLEHSRSSTGERAMTDLNRLADEYLRLSYHGMRAKNPSFTADYEFIADPDLPLLNVVPQDIGRVLLNLINNAFQSQAPPAPRGGANYHKKVTVKTFKIEADKNSPSGGWGVSVSDNGSGIPENIKEKIFQPFFTTKPTGEGTGLGLSLSYDIITKGHGGTIEVESVEGDGTTFTVKLPIQ